MRRRARLRTTIMTGMTTTGMTTAPGIMKPKIMKAKITGGTLRAGMAMITGLIPNQEFINKTYAMSQLSIMTTAFPKVVFDKTKIELRMKLLQQRRDIFKEETESEDKEGDALNVFFFSVSREEPI